MTLRSAVGMGALLLLVGCSSGSTNVAPSTIEGGKLTACTDMPYEPFEFEADGQQRGIDVDLVRAVAEEWELEAEFRDIDFDTIFTELEARRCDLVASAVSITPEREQAYLFSDGYFEINQSLMVRSADVNNASLSSLAGKRVAVQKGTTGADYVAAQARGVAQVEFDDASEAVAALRDRRVDGVVQDFPINSYIAQTSRDLAVVQIFTDVEREQYGFVFRKDATEQRDAANASLKKIRDDGRYDTILSNYLGRAVSN